LDKKTKDVRYYSAAAKIANPADLGTMAVFGYNRFLIDDDGRVTKLERPYDDDTNEYDEVARFKRRT